jgi:molybdopterin-containing oxidoreductase family iron-sulfur binding subunit
MTDLPQIGPSLDPEPIYPDPHNPEEAIDRRHFLALVSASAAVAGVAGCSPRPAPHGDIVPYVQKPEQLTPGVALSFATAMELGGQAIGLVVTSHEGRPTKVEGNPDHPASRGASDVYSQASLHNLYDPDRSKQVIHEGAPATWDDAVAALRAALEVQRAGQGAKIRILSGATSSPTQIAVMDDFLSQFPKARWVQYEPCGRDTAAEGAQRAFGEAVQPVYDFSKAVVVLSLDADFLSCEPGTVRSQWDFASRRRVRKDGKRGVKPEDMTRLYAVESMLTTTGANAEHRLAVRPSEVESFARALAAELKVAGAPAAGPLPETARAWLAPLARDLSEHRGRGIVLVGDAQPASLHALGHAVNSTLGNIGVTIRFRTAETGKASFGVSALKQLIQEMEAGQVDVLLILGSNPVFTTPADLNFAESLRKVQHTVHLGLHLDETAVVCAWSLPEAHFLETWGDCRSPDGTDAIQQPLIEPLYGGRSAIELLSWVLSGVQKHGRELVRDHWRMAWGDSDAFEGKWQQVVQKGVIPDATAKTRQVKLAGDWAKDSSPIAPVDGDEIEFLSDPVLYDGRFANNGWLQELPKPVTKLTWGNAALMSPATAAAHNIEQRMYPHGGQHGGFDTDIVELRYRGRTVQAPAFIVNGHADGAVTIFLGHGRERAGRIGDGVGFNGYALRTSDALGIGRGLQIAKTGSRMSLACTQGHHAMVGRHPIHHTTADVFAQKPRFFKPDLEKQAEKAAVTAPTHGKPPPPDVRDRRLFPMSLYPEWQYPDHKWGMAIDLSTCTGCSACVVACQAENNSPVVGKDQVLRGREMHWIRIDSYGTPDGEFFQPVPCMHCENAPCEYICPVEATVHSHDGLNDMIYNRCVGTRFCSNNCPYKVRRFNFLSYGDFTTPSLKPQRNPEVTVRSRGVMEKCTYCVQRIRTTEIAHERENKRIPANLIQTACEQACPSRAISFGDLNNPAEDVSYWKAEPHNYGLLDELYTQPRTTYLGAVRNPNPSMPRGA